MPETATHQEAPECSRPRPASSMTVSRDTAPCRLRVSDATPSRIFAALEYTTHPPQNISELPEREVSFSAHIPPVQDSTKVHVSCRLPKRPRMFSSGRHQPSLIKPAGNASHSCLLLLCKKYPYGSVSATCTVLPFKHRCMAAVPFPKR